MQDRLRLREPVQPDLYIYIYISFAGFGKQHPGSTFPGQNGTNAACMVWGKKAGCSLKAQYCAYDIHI